MAPKLRRPTGYGSSFSLLISDLYFVVALATHYDAHHAHCTGGARRGLCAQPRTGNLILSHGRGGPHTSETGSAQQIFHLISLINDGFNEGFS